MNPRRRAAELGHRPAGGRSTAREPAPDGRLPRRGAKSRQVWGGAQLAARAGKGTRGQGGAGHRHRRLQVSAVALSPKPLFLEALAAYLNAGNDRSLSPKPLPQHVRNATWKLRSQCTNYNLQDRIATLK